MGQSVRMRRHKTQKPHWSGENVAVSYITGNFKIKESKETHHKPALEKRLLKCSTLLPNSQVGAPGDPGSLVYCGPEALVLTQGKDRVRGK